MTGKNELLGLILDRPDFQLATGDDQAIGIGQVDNAGRLLGTNVERCGLRSRWQAPQDYTAIFTAGEQFAIGATANGCHWTLMTGAFQLAFNLQMKQSKAFSVLNQLQTMRWELTGLPWPLQTSTGWCHPSLSPKQCTALSSSPSSHCSKMCIQTNVIKLQSNTSSILVIWLVHKSTYLLDGRIVDGDPCETRERHT